MNHRGEEHMLHDDHDLIWSYRWIDNKQTFLNGKYID